MPVLHHMDQPYALPPRRPMSLWPEPARSREAPNDGAGEGVSRLAVLGIGETVLGQGPAVDEIADDGLDHRPTQFAHEQIRRNHVCRTKLGRCTLLTLSSGHVEEVERPHVEAVATTVG